MISNKYQFALVDYSWLARRSAYIISMGKHAGEYKPSEIIRLVFQSLAKLTNQLGITYDKVILIQDKWSKEWGGYYRTYLLKGGYKDTREYVDSLYVEKLRDEGASEEIIKKAEDEAYFNQCCMQAKQAVMNELTMFPSIFAWGAEADDIFNIFSSIYNPSGDPSIKKSVIISKDSDLKKSTSVSLDFYRYGTKADPSRVWTYEDAVAEIPQNLRDAGLSLYWYHSLLEALGAGHNDVKSPRKKGTHVNKVLEDIVLRGDYSDIEDKEMFDRAMSSFDLSSFPMYQEIIDTIQKKFMVCGRIPTLTEWKEFCDKWELEGISERYFSTFVSKLDRSMYLDPAPEQRCL